MYSSIASNPKIMARFVTTRRKCMELSNLRHPTINLSQLKNQHTTMSPPFRIDQPNFINVLTPKGKKVNKLAYDQERLHGDDDDLLMKEFKELLQRLEEMMEQFRVLEMDKFMCRIKGGMISVEDQEEAEVLSRELVNEILERPFKYFRREDVKLEDKLDDLKVLVGMFEQSSSCLGKNQQGDVSNKKSNSLCLRHYLN